MGNILFLMVRMIKKGAGDSFRTFREAADRAGMCPAAALLDSVENLNKGLGVEGLDIEGLRDEPAGDIAEGAGSRWQLPKRQLLECVCTGPSVGGQTLLDSLLGADWGSGVFSAVIDAARGLDPGSLGPGLGERLLWVQVSGAKQLVRALDLLLRDDNFALVAADMRGLPERDLQAVQPFAWYRLQRLAHQRAGGCVIFSDAPLVRCADRRVLLSQPRRLEELDRRRVDLLSELQGAIRLQNRGQVLAV